MNQDDSDEIDLESIDLYYGDMGGGLLVSPRILFQNGGASDTTTAVPRPIRAIVEQMVVVATTSRVIVVSDDTEETVSPEYEIVDPSDTFQNLSNDGPLLSDLCPICYDLFTPEAFCTRLSTCHHIFHRQCIEDAVRHQNLVCPVCRHDIKIRLKK